MQKSLTCSLPKSPRSHPEEEGPTVWPLALPVSLSGLSAGRERERERERVRSVRQTAINCQVFSISRRRQHEKLCLLRSWSPPPSHSPSLSFPLSLSLPRGCSLIDEESGRRRPRRWLGEETFAQSQCTGRLYVLGSAKRMPQVV